MKNETRREKQAEPRLQELRDLLTEGVDSGTPQVWVQDIFLQRMKKKVQKNKN